MSWEWYENYLAMGQRNLRKIMETPRCPVCDSYWMKTDLDVDAGHVTRTCANDHKHITELEAWEKQ